MPELPEVETTTVGLRGRIIGLTITDVWTNYDSPHFKGSETIKDPTYFKSFNKLVSGKKIIGVNRRAKNILIGLSSGKSILIHMKMTGHLLYGKYCFDKKSPNDPWVPIEPEGLKDPYNRRVRFVLVFNNGKHLALSDTRKFAKITLLNSGDRTKSEHLESIGPEPLNKEFSFEVFDKAIDRRQNGKIKQVLMDQSVIAGIGNIYADETLWLSGIHPVEKVKNIAQTKRKLLYKAIIETLRKSILSGGDSMSDYRNVDGEKGGFQEKHHAYQRTGSKCDKRGCGGTIVKITVGGRSTHYCNRHQILSYPLEIRINKK